MTTKFLGIFFRLKTEILIHIVGFYHRQAASCGFVGFKWTYQIASAIEAVVAVAAAAVLSTTNRVSCIIIYSAGNFVTALTKWILFPNHIDWKIILEYVNILTCLHNIHKFISWPSVYPCMHEWMRMCKCDTHTHSWIGLTG